MVVELVRQLKEESSGLVLVSGGCPRGPDAFAEEAGRIHGVQVVVHRPDLSKPPRFKAEPFFMRNAVIADDCTQLYAFVHPERTGGTENTIKQALRLNVPIFLVDLKGRAYLSSDGEFPTCEPVRHLRPSRSTG